MLVPILLTSCGDDMTAEDIANANFQKAETALTLSLWLPVSPTVDSNGDGVNDKLDNRFDERLQAVEEKINDYLRTNNYCTMIDIVAVLEDEYYEELTNKFDTIKGIEESEGEAHFIADKYVNHAIKNEETQVFEMAYPEILDQQLDIFFVGGYDNYTNYIENGDVKELDSFFTEGEVFNDIFKKIRSVYMNATKVDGSYYGIPNNHIYAEKGQYILVDKNLYDTYATDKWDDSFVLTDLKGYIETVGNQNLNNVVPYLGSISDAPGFVFLDEENMIAASISEAKVIDGKLTFYPEYMPENAAYKDFRSFYFGLQKNNLVSKTLADNQIAAVQIFEGNLIDLDNADDYYIIETIPPYANVDTLFSSMFAISSHSANYSRSMQILYLLQDNVELRTLLQYGIVEADYDIGTVNGEKVIYTKNSGYHMDLIYTGNCYRTYPASGVPMSYWDEIKQLNLETEIFPFMNVQLNIDNRNLSKEDMKKYDALIKELKVNNEKLKYAYEHLDYETYNKNEANTRQAYDGAVTAYENAQAAYNSAEAIYNSSSATASEKEAALVVMNESIAEMEKQADIIERYGYRLFIITYDVTTIRAYESLCKKLFSNS